MFIVRLIRKFFSLLRSKLTGHEIALGFCLGILLANSLLAAPEEFSSTTISVGVVVSDLDKSLSFYTDVVGMIRTGDFQVGEDVAKKSGLSNGVPLHVEVLRLGDGRDATQWKLMTFGDRSKTQKNEFIYDHTGMQYITINVHSLQPFLQRIREHNVKLLGETPIPLGSDPDRSFVLVQAPEGTIVELIGPLE